MDTRSSGKRLAAGITVTVAAGSLVTAGIASAVVYAATPSTKTAATTSTGSSSTGSSSTGSGSSNSSSGRQVKSYSGITPVQPGSGGAVHGKSSGS